MGICIGSPAKCAHVASPNYSEDPGNVKLAPSSDKNTQTGNLSSDLLGLEGDPFITNLKSFSFNDLKSATKNFSDDALIGEGGFGYVYKGWINESTLAPSKPGHGTVVAVKKLKPRGFQGHNEWLTEVKYLGHLHHKNLVKLIGYCSESNNRLLVYEFLPKGSLENHLFKKGVQPMPFAARMQIAVDIARGLAFLHTLDPSLIYRDLKASNILIDSKFHAKLSDFGLVRAGPNGDGSHVSTRVLGTLGYAAPEYVASGHLSPRSDVYSYGVVLLELLSGRRAVGDPTYGGAENILVDWAKPFLSETRQFSRIMDTRLRGEYSKKCAQAVASLALKCIDIDPKYRPAMVDVLTTLQQVQAATERNSQLQATLDHDVNSRSSCHSHGTARDDSRLSR